MAVMATDNKELSAAEEAYAAIWRFDKVDYIQYIKVTQNIIILFLGRTTLLCWGLGPAK